MIVRGRIFWTPFVRRGYHYGLAIGVSDVYPKRGWRIWLVKGPAWRTHRVRFWIQRP